MEDEDVNQIMKHHLTCIGSDGWAFATEGPLSAGKPHPRSYGTFPRVLGKYSRQDGVLTLQDAIRKMTSFPALKVGLRDRGLLREGFWADITIFDKDRIIDKATYKNPTVLSEGVEYVLINGTIALEKGKFTYSKSGIPIRKLS